MLYALQEHVYYKAIQDGTPDILAELLQLEGALQRYNPRLIEQPSSAERSGCTACNAHAMPGLAYTQVMKSFSAEQR